MADTKNTANSTPREKIYVLPNSELESNRLDFQHELLVRIFSGLNRAPLEKSKLKRILDIGCGTGNWASDFAKQYPEVEVLGIDIERKPGMKQEPSNFTFKIADLGAEETWTDIGTFDYIHGRFLAPAVRDWTKLLDRCLQVLAPGGWIEFQELHFPLKCADPEDVKRAKLCDWSSLMIGAAPKAGLDLTIMDRMPDLLTTAGYQQVKHEEYKMYSSQWPEDEESKELGRMGQENIITGLYGWSEVLFTRVLGWSLDQHKQYVDEAVDEVRAGTYRTWVPLMVAWARRPLTG